MKSSRKILYGFLALVILAFALLVILQTTGVLVSRFKGTLVSELEKATGRPVSIASLEGGVFGSITLHQVRIGPARPGPDGKTPRTKITARVERLVVSYSLIDLVFRRASVIESLKGLDFFSPDVSFHLPGRRPDLPAETAVPRSSSKLTIEDLEMLLAQLPKLPVRVSVNHGRLTLKAAAPLAEGLKAGNLSSTASSLAQKKDYVIEELRGSLDFRNLKNLKLRLRGTAQGQPGGRLRVKGRLRPQENAGEVTVSFKGLDLSPIHHFSLGREHWLDLSTGTADGRMVISSAPKNKKQWVQGLRVSGNLIVRHVEGRARGKKIAIKGLEGNLRLQNRSLDLRDLRFHFAGGQWRGKGKIADLRKPEVSMRILAEAMPLQRLAKMMPIPRGVSFTGRADAQLKIDGSLEAPRAVAILRGKRLGVAGISLENFETFFRAEKHGLWLTRLEARLDGADFKASGKVLLAPFAGAPRYATPTAKFHASLKNYSTELLAGRFGLSRVAGALTANLDFSGPVHQLKWSGKISSQSLTVAGEKFSDIQGTVNYGGGKLDSRLNLSWRHWKKASLVLQGESSSSRFMFKKISLSKKKTILASLSGFLENAPPRKLYLKGHIRGLRASDLPIENSVLKRIQGVWDATGTLAGTWADPVLDLELDGRKLKTKKGLPLPLRARLILEDRRLKLEQLSLRGGEVVGEAEWDMREREGSADFRLSAADLPVLTALLGESQAKSGRLDGKVSWVKAGLFGRTRVDLKGVQLEWGIFKAQRAQFEGELGDGRWKIKRFKAVQKEGGSASLTGRLNMTGADRFAQGKLSFKKWFLLGRRLDLEAMLKGGVAEEKKKSWWNRLASGKRHSARSGALEGRLEIVGLRCNAVPLNNVKVVWSLNQRVLKVSDATWGGLQASARWPFEKVAARWVNLKLNKVNARGIFLLGLMKDRRLRSAVSGSLVWRKARDESLQFDLRDLAASGEGTVKGSLNLGLGAMRKKRSLRVDLALQEAPLAFFKRLWPGAPAAFAAASGIFSGTLRISGSLQDPQVQMTQRVQSPSWKKYTFRRADITGRYSKNKIYLDSLELVDGEERIQLKNVKWKREADGSWEAGGNISSQRLPLLTFFKTDSVGRVHVKSFADGSMQGELDFKKLVLNRKNYGAKKLTLRWKNKQLLVNTGDRKSGARARVAITKTKVSYKDLVAWNEKGARLSLSGDQHIGKSINLELRVEKYDADSVTRLLDWKQDWTGTVWGTMTFRGPADKMRTVISAKVENGTINELRYDLIQGMVIAANKQVRLDPEGNPVVLRRKGVYEIKLGGTIPTSVQAGEDREMNLNVVMQNGDLGVLEYLDFVRAASGPTQLNLRITGTPQYPEVSGRIESRGGVIEMRGLFKRLEDVQTLLFFDKNNVTIHRLDAQAGEPGQRIYVEAAQGAPWAVQLERFVPGPLNLKLTSGKGGVQLNHTEELKFLKGKVFPKLIFSGTFEKPKLGGSFKFSDGEVIFPPKKSAYYSVSASDGDSLMDRLIWNMEIELGPEVIYRQEKVRVNLGEGDKIKVKGDWEHLGLLGKIRLVRGRLEYLNQKFNLDQARDNKVTFQGDKDPTLNVWAKQIHRSKKIKLEGENFERTMDVSVWMHAFGKLGKIRIDFEASEPKLTKAQIVSLVGLGEDVTDSSGSGARASRAAVRWLTGLVVGKGEREFEKLGIVDDIKVSAPILEDAIIGSGGSSSLTPVPEGETTPGTSANPSSAPTYVIPGRDLVEVKVSKRISEKVSVGGTATLEETGIQGDKKINTGLSGIYKLGEKTNLIGEIRKDKVTDDKERRVVIETSGTFGSYNSKKRKEMFENIENEEKKAAFDFE